MVLNRVLKSLADQTANLESQVDSDKIRASVSYSTILRKIDEAHGLLVEIDKSLRPPSAIPLNKLRIHDQANKYR